MNFAQKLCCTHLLDLEPYQSARRIGGSGEVWLNANELPFSHDGYGIDSSNYERYPESPSIELLEAYGAYAETGVDEMLCTRGADEGIELLIRAFCEPGRDSIVITTPTYGMYQVSAKIHGVEVIEVPRDAAFDLDIDRLKEISGSKLIFVCSPNNPTGNVSTAGELTDLLEHFSDSALVVVDEAYIEFCPERSFRELMEKHPNLVIIRTLSKAFGLAAVRCGFVLAHADVIGVLSNIIAPYPVPAPVEQIALQALSVEGVARMRNCVADIVDTREQFVRQISNLSGIVKVTASHGNFLLVEFEHEDRAVELLKEEGVVVRTPYTQGLISNSQRISIGTVAQMDRVVSALQQL